MSSNTRVKRPGIARLLNGILQEWREVGFLYVLQIAYWEIIPGWLFDFNAWVVTATDIRRQSVNMSHDPAIRWAAASDMELLVACGLSRLEISEALRRGARIAVYESDGRIIVHGWYGFAAYDQGDWVRFQLAPGEMLGIRIWVRPECRGQGLAPKVIRFVWSEMSRAGIERSVGIINVLNRNSRRALAKNDSSEAGRIYYLRFLGLTWVRYGAFWRIGSWNPGNRLDLMLAPPAGR